MNANVQTADHSVKDRIDLNKEFQQLTKELRDLGTERELINRCELFLQSYIENGYDASKGSYLYFHVIKPLIEEVFQQDISSNILYDKSSIRYAFDGQEHADTWKHFFYAYVGSDFIEGYKNDYRRNIVFLYNGVLEFFHKIIQSRSK